MKKLTVILLSILAISLVFTGCNAKKDTDDKNQNEIVNQNNNQEQVPQVQENWVLTNKTTTLSEGEVIESDNEYVNAIEDKLAQHVEKSPLDDEMLLKVGNIPLSHAFVKYANIQGRVSQNETNENMIEKDIYSFYLTLASIIDMAQANDITLSDEEWEYITSTITSFKEVYGEEFNNIFTQYVNHTPFSFFLETTYNILYDKIATSPESEFSLKARENVLKFMKENDYVRAKHVLVMFPEGETVTDEQKAETLAKANEVYNKAISGTDFDILVKDYGEDPGMTQYTGGYYFTKGKMVPAFEDTTYALLEGEISEPVETPYGYHVIQKLPLDDDAILLSDEYANEVFTLVETKIQEQFDSYEIVFAPNYQEYVDQYVAQAREIIANSSNEQ